MKTQTVNISCWNPTNYKIGIWGLLAEENAVIKDKTEQRWMQPLSWMFPVSSLSSIQSLHIANLIFSEEEQVNMYWDRKPLLNILIFLLQLSFTWLYSVIGANSNETYFLNEDRRF